MRTAFQYRTIGQLGRMVLRLLRSHVEINAKYVSRRAQQVTRRGLGWLPTAAAMWRAYHDRDTPCGPCGARAVFFNPYNKVTQCHSCGRIEERP